MSTTDSDTGRGTAQSAQCGPHSPEGWFRKPYAQARARAREASPETAQSQPDSAETTTVTGRDYLAEGADWFRGAFTPPDIWSGDRAALRKVWAYASRGEWTTTDGAARRAGQIYAVVVAVPVIFIAAVVEWVVERPSRLTAALVLVWLLSRVPPLNWLT